MARFVRFYDELGDIVTSFDLILVAPQLRAPNEKKRPILNYEKRLQYFEILKKYSSIY